MAECNLEECICTDVQGFLGSWAMGPWDPVWNVESSSQPWFCRLKQQSLFAKRICHTPNSSNSFPAPVCSTYYFLCVCVCVRPLPDKRPATKVRSAGLRLSFGLTRAVRLVWAQ